MASSGHSPAPRPHVVMMPFPMQGHITPLMQLSKLLAARGFSITFVSTEVNVKMMQKAKQGLMVSDLSKMGIRLVGIPDGRSDTGERNEESFLAALPFLHTSFDELVERMVQKEEMGIACIISDSFLLWTQDVADKWRIPRISFWPQSLACFACSISLPKIMAACPDLEFCKDKARRSSEAPTLLNCIPGLQDFDTSKLPFSTVSELGADWLRTQVQIQMERVNEPLCLICNTLPDLEREVFTHLKELPFSKPLFTLGPLLPLSFLAGQDVVQAKHTESSSMWDEDADCIEWLDMQHPQSVLYISLGSLATPMEREIHEIAMGLKACTVPFLWVLRFATCEMALSMQLTHGKVIGWAPQLRVLSHKAVGGFLTHCGWNSTIESISMGIPTLGWPRMMDQVTNCWFLVEKLKVGLRLELDASNNIERARLEKGIRILMQEEEGFYMRVRASHLSSLTKSNFTTSCPSTLDSLTHMILSADTNTSLQHEN